MAASVFRHVIFLMAPFLQSVAGQGWTGASATTLDVRANCLVLPFVVCRPAALWIHSQMKQAVQDYVPWTHR